MSASVGAASLESASVGNREIKAIFLGGGRVWAKIRTITLKPIDLGWDGAEINESCYVSGDKSMVASWTPPIYRQYIQFSEPVICDKECRVRWNGGGPTKYTAGTVIPPDRVSAPVDKESNVTYTEVG